MAIRRDSLRAQRDFFSPMTGNTGTEIRYAAAPTQTQSKYGSQVKERLSEIGQNTRRSAPIIKAIKTAMKKTDDPFTQIAEKKSYAPQEENDIGAQIQGLAGQAQDAIGEGVAQAESAFEEIKKGSNRRAAERRAERQADLKAARDARQNIRTDFQNRIKGVSDEVGGVRKEVKTQGDRFKSFSASQIKRDIQQDIAARKTAQDAKAYEQNRLKEGAKFKSRIAGVESGLSNLGKDYKAQEQRAIDNMAKFRAGLTTDVDKKISEVKKMYGQGGLALGTTTQRQGGTVKDGVKVEKKDSPAVNASTFQQKNVRGSGIPGKTGKDESARPKQVSNLPSNYKATEAKAFAKAKAFQQAKKVAQRNPNVSISKTTGKAEATNNSARARAQAAAVNRKMSGKSISQTKAANRASMKQAAAARHASFKKAKAAGTHARTASAQRARNKAAARKRAQSAAKKRRARKKSKKK